MAEPVRDHLDMLLLAVLSEGPAHGYAAIQELRRKSQDTFDMGEGTIYPALHRLERAGFVRSTHAIAAGRQRRVYRLTRAGRSALARKQSDWRRFEAAIHMVLRGEPSR